MFENAGFSIVNVTSQPRRIIAVICPQIASFVVGCVARTLTYRLGLELSESPRPRMLKVTVLLDTGSARITVLHFQLLEASLASPYMTAFIQLVFAAPAAPM